MEYTVRKNSPSKYIRHRKKNSPVNNNFNKCEINMLIPNYFWQVTKTCNTKND